MLWITVQSCVVWNTRSAYPAPCWTGSYHISLSKWTVREARVFNVRGAYVASLACHRDRSSVQCDFRYFISPRLLQWSECDFGTSNTTNMPTTSAAVRSHSIDPTLKTQSNQLAISRIWSSDGSRKMVFSDNPWHSLKAILLGTGQRLASNRTSVRRHRGSANWYCQRHIKSLGVTIDSIAVIRSTRAEHLQMRSYSILIRALRYILIIPDLWYRCVNRVGNSIHSAWLLATLCYLTGQLRKTLSNCRLFKINLARVVSGKRKFDHTCTDFEGFTYGCQSDERITYKVGCLTFKAKCIGHATLSRR